ncbi:hypothetical protein J1N35_007604, partial [Gossypium stocksii]
EFGGFHYFPFGDDPNKKGYFIPTPFIQSGSAIELNPYDYALHLFITWNLCPIKKHAKLRNTDYW